MSRLLAAAEAAQAAGRFDHAARLLDEALPDVPPESRVDAVRLRAAVDLWRGRAHDARQLLVGEADRIEEHDPSRAAAMLVEAAIPAVMALDLESAAEMALRAAQSPSTPPARYRCLRRASPEPASLPTATRRRAAPPARVRAPPHRAVASRGADPADGSPLRLAPVHRPRAGTRPPNGCTTPRSTRRAPRACPACCRFRSHFEQSSTSEPGIGTGRSSTPPSPRCSPSRPGSGRSFRTASPSSLGSKPDGGRRCVPDALCAGTRACERSTDPMRSRHTPPLPWGCSSSA